MLSEGTQAFCPVILEKTGLAAENITLAAENAALAPENITLAAENAALAPENIALAAEITALAAEKAALTAKNAALTAEKGAQAPENIALAAEITALTAEKVALTANIAAQVPEIAVLIVETTALTAERVALAAKNAALNGVNCFLERQRDVLNAALVEDNGAARAALTKQKITLTKQINCSALQLCQATFDLAKMEKTMETARAREEELEKELEDLKMTMKVEQEASFKQKEDLINQIIETEETLFIEQQEGKLTQQNTELQELALKTDENKEKSLGRMLSEVTQAFCRATRRVFRGALRRAPKARAREEELEKEIKDLKTKMKVKVEENSHGVRGEVV